MRKRTRAMGEARRRGPPFYPQLISTYGSSGSSSTRVKRVKTGNNVANYFECDKPGGSSKVSTERPYLLSRSKDLTVENKNIQLKSRIPKSFKCFFKNWLKTNKN